MLFLLCRAPFNFSQLRPPAKTFIAASILHASAATRKKTQDTAFSDTNESSKLLLQDGRLSIGSGRVSLNAIGGQRPQGSLQIGKAACRTSCVRIT